MFEKVNPCHPDKVADRIAGAIVDLAYRKNENPKIAVEVLIGHNLCTIIAETSEDLLETEIKNIVTRIVEYEIEVKFILVKQDEHLANNQKGKLRCGDNGIFKGVPITYEQHLLKKIANDIYEKYPTDGKYIINDDKLIICQSNADSEVLKKQYSHYNVIVNPLGEWSGGINVDSGATNRKLGSDMGDSVTGGGLHGKDLSKADVSVNIFAWLKAQEAQKPIELCCAIGDETVGEYSYEEIVETARNYIKSIGGFEKFAEWGLI